MARPWVMATPTTRKIVHIEARPESACTIVTIEHGGQHYPVIVTDQLDLVIVMQGLLRGDYPLWRIAYTGCYWAGKETPAGCEVMPDHDPYPGRGNVPVLA